MKRFFIGAILLFSYFVIFNSEAKAWFDTKWTYRIPVTINNNSNVSSLTDYQVKISLTSANSDFWAHVDSLGKDVRVVDSDDVTGLSYWLKHFDYEAQTASIWVKVPAIAANSSKAIYLYFTNSEAVSESSESNVMETSPQTFWTTTYHSGISTSGAEKTAFLSDGDIVVAGNYVNSVSGNTDWLIRRYDSSGNQVVWEQAYASGGTNNMVLDVAVDSLDNVIAVGYQNLADSDWHIRKYDQNGNLLWSKTYDFGSGADAAEAVAIDSSNNVIVTGYRADLGDQDWHTKKFNSAGEELWNVNYDSGTGGEVPRDVVCDSEDNIIVVGYSAGSGTRVFYMIKYNSNLVEIWGEGYEKGTSPLYSSVGVDSNNNIIVGGSYIETFRDWIVQKYDKDSNLLWSRLYDSGNGNDSLYSLAVDSLDNILTVGRISTSGALEDWMLRKYDSAGEIVWTSVEDIDRVDVASGVALNSNDDFVVCGWYAVTTDLYWRIRMYGERQYTDPEPSFSLGSLAKTTEKSFNNYVRFNSDSKDIKYVSAKKKFSLKFLKLPENPSRYWIEIKRIKKWPNFIDQKKTVKYYWRLKTNLYKAKGKKPFKLYLYFNYTKKSVKKRLNEKKLKLYWKQKNYIDEEWKERKKTKVNKKKRLLRIQVRKFGYLNNWYAIIAN